jgi:hypothetical protein
MGRLHPPTKLHDHVRDSTDAVVVRVEYSDFEYEYCGCRRDDNYLFQDPVNTI